MTFSITLITFAIVRYYLEQPLKVVLENNWIKNKLLQINFSGFFKAFAYVLKDNYLSEQLLMTGFVIILLKWKTHRNI